MEFLSLLTQTHTQAFLLLLCRFSGILFFFPFFNSNLIPMSIKAALVFFMSVLFFPQLPNTPLNLNIENFFLSVFMELLLGFLASIALSIVFSTLSFAGDTLSFSMGLTIASAYDPATGSQKPIVAQVIIILGILFALALDFHHTIFSFIAQSIHTIPLGGFSPSMDILENILKSFAYLFSIGFAMAFPILGLMLLTDIILGMIMKTHPQFNLFAIGFPLKIALALIAIALVIPSIMSLFENHLKLAFASLYKMFL